jgi:hypothetical protein
MICEGEYLAGVEMIGYITEASRDGYEVIPFFFDK